MAKESKWQGLGWAYVNNPAGGFYCFYFTEYTVALKPYEAAMYLQIEDATRLTVRCSERKGPGIQAPFMNGMLELLESKAQLESKDQQTDDIMIKKAGRFRGGASAAVAEVTFGDESSYIALKDGGIVDMDATMHRLDRVREFIQEAALYALLVEPNE